MPRNHLILPLLLFLSLSAALALAGALAGVKSRAREWQIGEKRGSFAFFAPSAVSGDDKSSELSSPSPPSSSPSSSPSDVDALAARVAERLEPLLLRQARAKEEGESAKEKEKGSSGESSPPLPSPSPSPPSSRSSSASAASGFKTFFQALLGASVASALLLAGEHQERRKKAAARGRADLLDALRGLDDAAARRLLGQVGVPGWAKFPDFEKCAFANAALAQLWPYVCLAASEAAREMINPLLEEQRPPWMTKIAITKFELGPRPPTLEGIKVFPPSARTLALSQQQQQQQHRPVVDGAPGTTTKKKKETAAAAAAAAAGVGGGGQSDAVVVEVDVDWAGSQAIELVVNPLPSLRASPRSSALSALLAPASRAIAKAVKLRAGVESVSASARLRMEFGPLEGRLPIVPQLSLSLVDFPTLGFDLTLYGGDVTLLPGLESFLSAVLRDAVLRPLVLPGRLVVDLPGGGEEAALGFDRPEGMLFVRVEEAARLPRADLFSAADCYVKVGTTGGGGPKKRRRKKHGKRREEGSGAREEESEEEERRRRELVSRWSRTRTIPNRTNPRWQQQLRPLLIRDPENELLDFVLMDADELGADDEVGRCSVRVSAVVAALREKRREQEEREEERERRRRRRAAARPPSPVRRPEAATAAEAAGRAAAPAVVFGERVGGGGGGGGDEERGEEGGEERGEREDEGEEGGSVVVGRLAAGADAGAAGAPVCPPSAAASSAPVTDRGSGTSGDFFVGVPVDDEETRGALSPSPPEEEEEEVEAAAGAEEANSGGGGGENGEEEDVVTRTPSDVEALRGSGSVDDPLELWLPCPRLSSSSSPAPASSASPPAALLEWGRRPPSGGGARGARDGCWGCLSAFVSPLFGSRIDRGGGPAGPSEGPPLLRVKLSYHAFSEEEIELAGGKKKKKESEGEVENLQTASSPPIPMPPVSPSSRAADILGGGILFVRPRQAKNLRPLPLWRRALLRRKAAWVVRVAVAGGVSEEGGPVSKGGTSPQFTEPIELVLGAKDLARARRRSRSSRGGESGDNDTNDGETNADADADDALVSLQVLDVSLAGVDSEGRRRRARITGEATVRWRDLVSTGRLQGEFPLVEFAPGTEEEALLEEEGEGEGESFVESSRRRRSLLRAPPRGYESSTDAGMTATSGALGEDQPTLSAELAWLAFV